LLISLLKNYFYATKRHFALSIPVLTPMFRFWSSLPVFENTTVNPFFNQNSGYEENSIYASRRECTGQLRCRDHLYCDHCNEHSYLEQVTLFSVTISSAGLICVSKTGFLNACIFVAGIFIL
jgi:hypothetical protein